MRKLSREGMVARMIKYKPEGRLGGTVENRSCLSGIQELERAFENGTVLEARALLCDNSHNLHVDLNCMRGIIPRCEGALGIENGSVRDIALISRVNKPVMFKIIGFENDAEGKRTAILSRRLVQEECMAEYISELSPGDVIEARVTHLEGFGAFADIGAGVASLLPIDAISVSRIPHPGVRLSVGTDIKAVVKSIGPDGRVTLSHKELLGTWEQNAAEFTSGETIPGVIRSIEKYGIFVELAPNLAGLAELTSGIHVGQHATVYIKSIIPERMKIKLIIVDAFDAVYPVPPTRYFTGAAHISHWV